jgi:hypothetical protein
MMVMPWLWVNQMEFLIPFWPLEATKQWKRAKKQIGTCKKKNSWKICIILKPPTFKPRIFLISYHKKFNTFFADLQHIPLWLNFDSIQFNLNPFIGLTLVEWELNSNKFKSNQINFHLNSRISIQSNPIQFNSNCMKCHSIFSFKWNLIFTKSIHFFIKWSTLIVHGSMEPK